MSAPDNPAPGAEHPERDRAWPFREVARRTVGGGSKTAPADEITWTGLFGGRRLTFTTRPRLLTAHASFLVSSNARLRTSILKRDEGHFIDLCVRDRVLDDAERMVLQALAQAQDPERPVQVRHRGEPVRGGDRHGVTRVQAPFPDAPDGNDPGPQLSLF
jgi:hypothetical protein